MNNKFVVLVTRKLPQAVEDRLRRDYEPRFNRDDNLYTTDELIALAQGADILLPCHTEKLSADVIARLPDSIKAIVCFSVGTDYVDLAAAKARNIVVTNTPDVLTDATAEIAMLLMLGAARRASEGERLIRAGKWKSWSPTFMLGRQVTGKRLGIVGMGRVGQATAQRARGFDMTILYSNRSRLSPELEKRATYFDSVEAMLPRCDYLALHCPATPETHHLLNAERIAQLPDGAIVVNTARGSVIDDEAMVSALLSGKLAAAGLDVFNGEPDNIHPAYRELENTFLLPHIG
ncbi:MAG: D-glycerate dehydrogenase, partial [Gallionella sp.]